jgi:1,2-diacylglycerol 3-alpha-glucosyltransferase
VNVAIATDFCSPWIGGPATFIDNFSSFLAARGHNVQILAPSQTSRPAFERRPNGVAVARLPSLPLPFGYQVRVTYRVDSLGQALQSLRPDVLQIHHPFPLGLAAMVAARRQGLPVVAVNHTIPECSLYGLRDSFVYPPLRAAFRRGLIAFLSGADEICTPTRTAAALLHEMGITRTVEVISNGVDTARFTPREDKGAARRLLGYANKPTVLYTGRLDAEKDMTTWLRAGAALSGARDVQLVVGGEGADKARLRRLASTLGLEHRVIFPGYLPAADLPTLYQAADVYCITSAVELQSITTLEALSSGLPIVAADACALPELIEDGRNGYLVAPGDVEGFSTALQAVLQSPNAGRDMGQHSRKLAEQHALGQVASRHEALLQRVCNQNYRQQAAST